MGSRVVPLGTTGLEVTNLAVSASTLGSVRNLTGTRLSESEPWRRYHPYDN